MKKIVMGVLVTTLCVQGTTKVSAQEAKINNTPNTLTTISNEEKYEITYIHNKTILSKGIVLSKGDNLAWEENIELWELGLNRVMCSDEEMQNFAYLELDELNLEDVDINKSGKYTVKAKLKLFDMYAEDFYITDEIRTLEIPVYICEEDELYMGHVATSSDFIEFHWVHKKEDETPSIYYAEKINDENEEETLPEEDEFKLVASEDLVASSGRFLVYRTFLDKEKVYYFRLKIGDKTSNIMRVYGNTAEVIDDGTGGDRDPSEPGGTKPPDIVQPPPKPDPDLQEPPITEDKVDEDEEVNNEDDNIHIDTENDNVDDVVALLNNSSSNNENKEVLEQVNETKDIISGTRLKKMIEGNEVITFSKQGITIYIPCESLKNLNIKDDDIFEVTINKTSKDEFLINIKLNDNEITQITNSSVMMNYKTNIKNSNLTLLNQNKEIISNGEYDEGLEVATFIIDQTGKYKIVEENKSNTSSNEETDSENENILPVIPISVISLSALGIWVYKKRKPKE